MDVVVVVVVGRFGWLNRRPLGWIAGFAICAMLGGWFGWTARKANCQRAEHDYIGAQRCRGCHEQAYQTWARSAHAKAYDILSEKDRRNPLCLRCHSIRQEPHLRGVQCEICHGPGRYYANAVVMKDRQLARAVGLLTPNGEKSCLTCHRQTPKLRAFHFPTMWKKIAHKTNKANK